MDSKRGRTYQLAETCCYVYAYGPARRGVKPQHINFRKSTWDVYALPRHHLVSCLELSIAMPCLNLSTACRIREGNR